MKSLKNESNLKKIGFEYIHILLVYVENKCKRGNYIEQNKNHLMPFYGFFWDLR